MAQLEELFANLLRRAKLEPVRVDALAPSTAHLLSADEATAAAEAVDEHHRLLGGEK